MKIRQDFVTNSSSSSFTILGKEVNIKDIDLSKGKYICIGKELCDGLDVFELNEEIFEYLKNETIITKLTNKFDEDLEYLYFYKYFYKRIDNNYGKEISLKELIDKIGLDGTFNIFSFDKDYHSSEDICDIKMRYGDDNI